MNIDCLPPIIVYTGAVGPNSNWEEFLCKWTTNGTNYYDSYLSSRNDCQKLGLHFDLTGFNVAYTQSTNFNLVQAYLDSGACGRWVKRNLILTF